VLHKFGWESVHCGCFCEIIDEIQRGEQRIGIIFILEKYLDSDVRLP
jgi:hypothetical protein